MRAMMIYVLAFILFIPLPAHSSNKKVILLPLALYAEKQLDHIRKGAASMLNARLSQGGLEVMSGERIEAYLEEEEKQGISSEKRAHDLMSELGAGHAVFGSITVVGNTYSLDFSLIKSAEGLTPERFSKVVSEDQFIAEFSTMANRLLDAIEEKALTDTSPAKPPVIPETGVAEGIFSKPEGDRAISRESERGVAFKQIQKSRPLKPTGTIPLTMEVMSFDMGDLDGDGTVELVLVDRKNMIVYRREGNTFVLIDSLKASWGEEFFKVSVGDIDHNGKAEIYAVSLYGMRARTSVYEWTQDFRMLERKIGHLHVIRDPIEGKSLLLFQGSKVSEFFSGPIYSMNYNEKGEPIQGEKLPEMKGAQFYTLIRSDFDEDGKPEWLGFGEADLSEQSGLHLWDERGQLLWKGKNDLGGTNNAVRVGQKKYPDDQPARVSFNSRLVFSDIDGNGKKEVVTLSNIPLIEYTQDFKVYTKSQLIAYEKQGSGLFPGWTTGEFEYCITELQVYEHGLFLAGHKGKMVNIGKSSGVIMWFE
jgi:hypothetical protein